MKATKYLIPALAVAALSAVVLLTTGEQQTGLRLVAKACLLVAGLGAAATWILHLVVGPEKTRKIVATSMLLLFSLLISLVIAEFAARLAFSDVTTTVDNRSYFARKWKQSNPPQRNRYGYREREFSHEKPDDVYRIAVIGDSFTYGQGIEENERFSNMLETRLNETGKPYEVLNFGRPGAETIDEVAIFEKDVLAISPDFVLLQWYINDVQGHDKSAKQQPYRLIPSKSLSNYLNQHSALFYLVNARWKALQSDLGLIESYNDYVIKRFSDPDSPASRAAAAALEKFFRLAEQHAIPVGVVMFPRLLEVSGAKENYPFGFLIDQVTAICRRHDVPCVDLRPHLAKIQPARDLWANRLDPHPGPLANEIATEALMERFGSRWNRQRKAATD